MTIFKVVFIIIFIFVQIPTCDSSLSSRDLIFPISAQRSPAIVTMPTSAVPEPARTPTNPITFATVRGPDSVETVATDVSFYQQCFLTNLRHRDDTMCVIFFYLFIANLPFVSYFYFAGPITSIFEDGHYILYNYLLQQKTHNNDFSVRFRTAQDNAVLFQTYSTRGLDEYIRAVLENGRVKVTFRINGVDQVCA